MAHKKLCILITIIFALSINVSYAAKGKIGPMAELNSDNILIKSDKPIRDVYILYKTDSSHKDLDVLQFIQALEIELYKKGFRIAENAQKADVILSLEIKKIYKEYWAGLPTMFGNQRRIGCLSVNAIYETTLGQWVKEFVAHKGYWTFKGDSYYRDITKSVLARAIINPLHDYPKEKALIEAAGNGNIKAVMKFVEENININADNDLGVTPLIAASKNGHVEVVELIISLDGKLDARDEQGWSALTYSAQNNNEDIALILLNAGAYVNTEDDDKRTPLDWAVLKGNKFLANLFLNHGAKVGNALELAKEQGNEEIKEMLLTHETKEKQLVSYDCRYLSGLIRSENKEKIQFLMENNLVIAAPEDDMCQKTLMVAARKGNTQIINAFLNKGFSANVENDKSQAPLIEAAAEGHKEVVEMLTANGADLRSFGSSALVSAAMNGKKKVVEYLLSQRVDINAQSKTGDTSGETPLGEAVRAGQKDIIELLLSKGARINAKNNNGKTALMVAALDGNTEIVKLLLSKGADIDQEDPGGNTVLELVSRARMHDNTIDYKDVIDTLNREKRKKSDKRRTLRSRD